MRFRSQWWLVMAALLFVGSEAALGQQEPSPPASTSTPTQNAPEPQTPPPERVRVGGIVQSAYIIKQIRPKYPPEAKAKHIEGTVVLHAIIAKEGYIKQLEVISGPPELTRAAMDAVKKWRYKPTMFQGKPVEVDTKISVIFTLHGGY